MNNALDQAERTPRCPVTSLSSTDAQVFLYDGNGNVIHLTDESGSVAGHYEYDPFGNVILAEGAIADENTWQFSTKYFDAERELSYYGYRYYDAVAGRWISRDPIGESGGVALYGFVGNDGVKDTDLWGLEDPVIDLTKANYMTDVKKAKEITLLADDAGLKVMHTEKFWSMVKASLLATETDFGERAFLFSQSEVLGDLIVSKRRIDRKQLEADIVKEQEKVAAKSGREQAKQIVTVGQARVAKATVRLAELQEARKKNNNRVVNDKLNAMRIELGNANDNLKLLQARLTTLEADLASEIGELRLKMLRSRAGSLQGQIWIGGEIAAADKSIAGTFHTHPPYTNFVVNDDWKALQGVRARSALVPTGFIAMPVPSDGTSRLQAYVDLPGAAKDTGICIKYK